MSCLNLILKKLWFEKQKEYEYRQIKSYYAKIFCCNYKKGYNKCIYAECDNCHYFYSRNFNEVILRSGYTNIFRIYRKGQYKADINYISNKDWKKYTHEFIKDGYEPTKKYFRIKL